MLRNMLLEMLPAAPFKELVAGVAQYVGGLEFTDDADSSATFSELAAPMPCK